MEQAIPNSLPKPLVQANQSVLVISVLLSWLTGWYVLLLLPLAAGLGGIFFQYNFVIQIAKRFLKKPTSAYLPEDKADLRFNQTIASSLLALSFLSFLSGQAVLGYLFSGMVLMAASVALMGFCVGCFIRYQWVRYRHRVK